MGIGSLQNGENEPLVLGLYITYDVTKISRKKVQTEVEKVKNIINL